MRYFRALLIIKSNIPVVIKVQSLFLIAHAIPFLQSDIEEESLTARKFRKHSIRETLSSPADKRIETAAH